MKVFGRKLTFKPHCTCGSDNQDEHYFSCDLFYIPGKMLPKRKSFHLFYPLVPIFRKGRGHWKGNHDLCHPNACRTAERLCNEAESSLRAKEFQESRKSSISCR